MPNQGLPSISNHDNSYSNNNHDDNLDIESQPNPESDLEPHSGQTNNDVFRQNKGQALRPRFLTLESPRLGEESTSKVSLPTLVATFCTIMTVVGVVLIGVYPSKFVSLCELIQGWYPFNWLVCAVVLIVWMLVCLPSTMIEIASGFIFGLIGSFVLTLVAKTAAAYLSFLIGERLGGKAMKEKMKKKEQRYMRKLSTSLSALHGEFHHLYSPPGVPIKAEKGEISKRNEGLIEERKNEDINTERRITRAELILELDANRPPFDVLMYRAISKNPWKFTILLRLSYIPLGIKNYGSAYLPCPLYVYLICSFVASIPYSLLWASVGSNCRDLVEITDTQSGLSQKILLGVAVALTFAIFIVIKCYTKKEMKAINRIAVENADVDMEEFE